MGVDFFKKTTLFRCLAKVEEQDYRKTICQICFDYAKGNDLTLILYDVTILYFEIQEEDKYRKPGLSKERRLEPQIIIGLLVDRYGFPLGLHSFEGNTAETKTILPVIEAFQAEHGLKKATIVADAAMLSKSNLEALEQAGYTYIVGSRFRKIPYEISEYQKTGELADEQIVVKHTERNRIIYQYRSKRAALDIRNIKKQITKAEKAISGKTPITRTKFVSVKAKSKELNQGLIDKAYALAGIKGYVTNLDIPDKDVISYYHQLFQVEATFRMAKSDLRARPVYQRKREAIEAHLTIILAALAVSRYIERQTDISLKQFIKLLRPIRSGYVSINGMDYLAEPEIPNSVKLILEKLDSGH